MDKDVMRQITVGDIIRTIRLADVWQCHGNIDKIEYSVGRLEIQIKFMVMLRAMYYLFEECAEQKRDIELDEFEFRLRCPNANATEISMFLEFMSRINVLRKHSEKKVFKYKKQKGMYHQTSYVVSCSVDPVLFIERFLKNELDAKNSHVQSLRG
jgi:hypothetical protein